MRILLIDAVLAFWLAYIFHPPTRRFIWRPSLAASRVRRTGPGTILTSAIFLVCIVVIVLYMTATHHIDDDPLVAEQSF